MTVNLLAQIVFDVTSPTKLTVTVPLQLSVVVTADVFDAGIADEQVTVTFAGQVICGATLSFTVIIWEQVAVLPQTSVAIYVRVIVNLFAQTVLDVTSDTILTVTVPPQLSVVVTPAVFAVGMFKAQLTVTLAGQVICGATLSATVII